MEHLNSYICIAFHKKATIAKLIAKLLIAKLAKYYIQNGVIKQIVIEQACNSKKLLSSETVMKRQFFDPKQFCSKPDRNRSKLPMSRNTSIR